MTETAEFAPGTLLAEMRIDIYSDKESGDVWIWHDAPFDPPVSSLEFTVKEQKLVFVFEDGTKKYLGAIIRKELVPYFQKSEEISFAEVNMETKQAVDLFQVPIVKI
jgi:hypothetical protein